MTDVGTQISLLLALWLPVTDQGVVDRLWFRALLREQFLGKKRIASEWNSCVPSALCKADFLTLTLLQLLVSQLHLTDKQMRLDKVK